VIDASGRVVGIVEASALRVATSEAAMLDALTLAADLMQPATTVDSTDSLRTVAELFVSTGQKQLPILGADGKIQAFIDESTVTRAYLSLLTEGSPSVNSPPLRPKA
jgi:CBS domain-containing protein